MLEKASDEFTILIFMNMQDKGGCHPSQDSTNPVIVADKNSHSIHLRSRYNAAYTCLFETDVVTDRNWHTHLSEDFWHQN